MTSAGNSAGVDVLTVDPTTAVTVTDSLIATTSAALTINGRSTDTITENNLLFFNAGITVKGDGGTIDVSITQTESALSRDGVVTITDAGFATKAAGTIATVTLEGLSHAGNAINDNALAALNVWNSDTELTTAPTGVIGPTGAQLTITDNLATPTATTLALDLENILAGLRPCHYVI